MLTLGNKAHWKRYTWFRAPALIPGPLWFLYPNDRMKTDRVLAEFMLSVTWVFTGFPEPPHKFGACWPPTKRYPKWGGENLPRSQLGETERVTGAALELKGEHICAITLQVEFHCTQREVKIYTIKKDAAGRAFSRELCLDWGTNASDSDFQLCQTIITSAPLTLSMFPHERRQTKFS